MLCFVVHVVCKLLFDLNFSRFHPSLVNDIHGKQQTRRGLSGNGDEDK